MDDVVNTWTKGRTELNIDNKGLVICSQSKAVMFDLFYQMYKCNVNVCCTYSKGSLWNFCVVLAVRLRMLVDSISRLMLTSVTLCQRSRERNSGTCTKSHPEDCRRNPLKEIQFISIPNPT